MMTGNAMASGIPHSYSPIGHGAFDRRPDEIVVQGTPLMGDLGFPDAFKLPREDEVRQMMWPVHGACVVATGVSSTSIMDSSGYLVEVAFSPPLVGLGRDTGRCQEPVSYRISATEKCPIFCDRSGGHVDIEQVRALGNLITGFLDQLRALRVASSRVSPPPQTWPASSRLT